MNTLKIDKITVKVNDKIILKDFKYYTIYFSKNQAFFTNFQNFFKKFKRFL